MKPSMIVYGVKGGKTRFAERIAKFYGLINGGKFSHKRIMVENHVYFYDGTVDKLFAAIISKSFSEVADEINTAIPLTALQAGEPTIVGEYDVYSSAARKCHRRWWHGDRWSFALLSNSQAIKNVFASEFQGISWRPFWRGLSEEPINTEE